MSQKLYLALLLHKKTINICNNTKYGIYFSVKCSNLTSVTQVLEIPLIKQSDYKIYYNTKYGNMPPSPLSKNSYSPFINRILSSIQHIQNTGGGSKLNYFYIYIYTCIFYHSLKYFTFASISSLLSFFCYVSLISTSTSFL